LYALERETPSRRAISLSPWPAAASSRAASTRSATVVGNVSRLASRPASSSAALQDPKCRATQELDGQRGCSRIQRR
jgi:hypothetical protein